MRVLVDNGGYDLINLGDIAMCQVAVSRLMAELDNLQIDVLTTNPERFPYYYPSATPVVITDSSCIRGRSAVNLAKKALRTIRYRYRVVDEMRHKIAALRGEETSAQTATVHIDDIQQYDAVAVAGGGFLCDNFIGHATGTLELLAQAISAGIPTFIFGSGFGPIKNAHLLERCQATLPKVKFICVRQSIDSPQFLESCGVHPDNIHVTGDDALELAYTADRNENAGGIGISLRYSASSPLPRKTLSAIRNVLAEFSSSHGSTILTIPILIDGPYSDILTAQRVFKGVSSFAVPGPDAYRSVSQVISSASQCRLVVTSSYHAGVFALGQGIPVVFISNSGYYDSKFAGLKHLFEPGVQMLDGQDCCFDRKLREAVRIAWDTSTDARSTLLEMAASQVMHSRQIYADVGRYIRQHELAK